MGNGTYFNPFEDTVKTEGDATLEQISSYAGPPFFMGDSQLRPDGFRLLDTMVMPMASSKYSHCNGSLEGPSVRGFQSGPALSTTSLDSSCGSSSTSPGSASSSFLFTPSTTYSTNGSNFVPQFSPVTSTGYTPSVNYSQPYPPLLYDNRPRTTSITMSTSGYGPAAIPPQSDTSPLLPTQMTQDSVPPFQPTRTFAHGILAANGTPVQVDIQAKIDKGFFKTDSDWTCYRRNYFSVACSYTLNPYNTKMEPFHIRATRGDGNAVAVQSFAIGISARVDGEDGKQIELVQHTPKRDKGPTGAPEKTKLLPHTGACSIYSEHVGGLSPRSGLSSDYDTAYAPTSPSSQQSQTVATFERIQFKNATANNGKRRAAQQYFHIVVELFAETPGTQSTEPQWTKLASRISAPMVVRGRSPGHYADDRRGSSTSMGPGGGSSGDSAGSQRDPHSGSSGVARSGVAGMFSNPPRLGTSGGNGHYKGHQKSSDLLPADSLSDHSSTSSEYENVEMLDYERSEEPVLTPEEEDRIENHEGYQYYPSTLLEAPAISNMPRPLFPSGPHHSHRLDPTVMPSQQQTIYGHSLPPSSNGLVGVGRLLGSTGVSPSYATAHACSSGIAARSCRRFEGVGTSKGWYPETPAL
ncbi:MAG: hypothetical protein Q9226_004334 [Calogaya cf. arnoldii]